MTIRLQNITNADAIAAQCAAVQPMHYIMLNFPSWDENPTVATPRGINLGNLRSALLGTFGWKAGMSAGVFPPNSDMWFDLEAVAPCVARWDNMNPHDLSPRVEVFAALESIIKFARSVRPDCKFGFYNYPASDQYAYTLDLNTPLGVSNEDWLNRMIEAQTSLGSHCDYAMPGFYFSARADYPRMAEYARIALTRIRNYFPHKKIIPFISPWCSLDGNDASNIIDGNQWSKLLSVLVEFGISDVIVWGEGYRKIDESAAWWIETLKVFGDTKMEELQMAVANLVMAYQIKQAQESELESAKVAVKEAVDKLN